MKPTSKRRKKRPAPQSRWLRFDAIRTEKTGGDPRSLDTHVDLIIPPHSTHVEVLKIIVSQVQPPLKIELLDEMLNQIGFPRGKTIFGLAGDAIDNIASNYDQMHWWFSKDGLNMLSGQLAAHEISAFDKLAGKLVLDGSKNGRISKELLMAIAEELDKAGFTLKKELQLAQWAPIGSHNQIRGRGNPITTFVGVCQKRLLAKWVRKRLYVARERYLKSRS